MPTDLIRQIDAAERFKVSRQYINKLVREEKLRAYTVAKLVSMKELKEFMKSRDLLVDKVNQ